MSVIFAQNLSVPFTLELFNGEGEFRAFRFLSLLRTTSLVRVLK